jgi:hypothetical protein
MALPALDKTWEINIQEFRSLGFGNSYQMTREMMFQLKESLVNGGVAPWTVGYSYNGTTLGVQDDAVDHWASRADCNFGHAVQDGTTNRSWIVLKQPGILAGFELMIILGGTYAQDFGTQILCYYSPSAGFTGGGTGNDRPTATDEVEVLFGSNNNTNWIYGEDYPVEKETVMYTWRSDDGACTRVFMWNVTNQRCMMHLQLDKVKNPIPEWTYPVLCGWASSNGGSIHSYGAYNDQATRIRSSHPNDDSEMQLYFTSEGAVSSMGGQNQALANDLNGEYAIYPMGCWSGTLNAKGRHGEVFDMWWIPTSLLTHATMPLTPSATREFMVHDDILMVHDGSVPIVL